MGINNKFIRGLLKNKSKENLLIVNEEILSIKKIISNTKNYLNKTPSKEILEIRKTNEEKNLENQKLKLETCIRVQKIIKKNLDLIPSN